MKRYTIIVEYDGTEYYGWQLQPGVPSITGQLQGAFKRVFNHTITLVGASRTDAGVHAHGQVATFITHLVITPDKMLAGWNNALPSDILVRSVSEVPMHHTIFDNVKRKTYYYHIFLSKPSPLYQRYGWYYKRAIDQEKLYQVLQHMVGHHDFTSLCAADTPDPNRVRAIESIMIEYIPHWNALRIMISAERFLRYMIRRMVGAAVKIASYDTIPVDYIRDILEQKNPNNGLPQAPAQGLLLHVIEYNKERYD